MGFDDAAADRQPQTAPLLVAQFVKFLKNLLLFARYHPRPLIADLHPQLPLLLPQLDGDLRTVGGELDRIGQQIGQHLADSVLIGRHRQGCRDVCRYLYSVALGGGGQFGDALPDHQGQVALGPVERRDGAHLDLLHIQHGVDHPDQPVGVFADQDQKIEEFLPLVAAIGSRLHPGQPGGDILQPPLDRG